MTDFRRKHEFIMTKCKCQMLGSIFNSVNLPGNFKTCGFFLLPKNPKLYSDHFSCHGYLDFYGFELKSNTKIEEGSRFSFDRKRHHHNINDDMTYEVNHVLPRCWK